MSRHEHSERQAIPIIKVCRGCGEAHDPQFPDAHDGHEDDLHPQDCTCIMCEQEREPKQVADLTCDSCIAQDGSAHAPHCEYHSPGDADRLAAEQKLRTAVASFPERFGLRGFPGDVFRVSTRDSYVGDNMEPVIYTERETQNAGNVTFWQVFAKASPEEVRRNLVEKP